MPKFETGKRYKMRDGRMMTLFHIFETLEPGAPTLLGLIDGETDTERWYADGSWILNQPSTHDLMPDAETAAGFLNWYESEGSGEIFGYGWYRTVDEALAEQLPNCVGRTRVEFRKGQFDT